MKRLLIPLVFLCCFGCQQGEDIAAVDVEADIQAIKDAVADFNVALNTGDIDKVSFYHADEVVVIPPNRPAIEKETYINSLQQLFDRFTTYQEDFSVKHVQVGVNLAVANFLWSFNGTPKGVQEPIKANGNWTLVLKKQSDDTWKIIYSLWSDEGLVIPQPTE